MNENKKSLPNNISSYVFDKLLLNTVHIKPQYYVMGVDTCDKDALTYCLSKKVDGNIEIIMCKTIRDKNEFEDEVKILANIFDATIFRFE